MPGAFSPEPLDRYGLWAVVGTLVGLGAFFLLRGRIAIAQGWAGRTLKRFGWFERFVHWLLAASFVVLALTGLNARYGRHLLLPLLGTEDFSALNQASTRLHTYAGAAFVAGLALTFVVWIRHSFPGWRDTVWLAKGGGMIIKGSHPPAWKFNAGQKILFWLVMLGGLSLSLSGIVLLLPGETALPARTIALFNLIGVHLPVPGNPQQEAHYASFVHGIAALGLLVVVIVHGYLRTLGVQGAFAAMTTGQVDVNWAKQHHSLWAAAELQRMEEVAAAVTDAARSATPPR